MESRIKFLGHPVHPMLVVFPLGLLSTAVIFDVLYIATANVDLATFAYWALVAGIVGGAIASIFGLVDWMGLPRDTRARRIGAMHGVGNSVVLAAFVVSFIARADEAAYRPDLLPFLSGAVGVAIAAVTAWLGGELVYRLRVAVDADAHLNASSSVARDREIEVKA